MHLPLAFYRKYKRREKKLVTMVAFSENRSETNGNNMDRKLVHAVNHREYTKGEKKPKQMK